MDYLARWIEVLLLYALACAIFTAAIMAVCAVWIGLTSVVRKER